MKLVNLKLIVVLTVFLNVLTGCSPEKLQWIKYDDSIMAVETTPGYCLAKGVKASYVVYGTYKLFGRDLQAGQCAVFGPPYKAYYRIKSLVDDQIELSGNPKVLAQIKSQEEVIKKLQLNEGDL